MGTATRTINEMRDIINNDMRDIYDRPEGEDDIREVLELEGAMYLECERRDADARALIRGEQGRIRRVQVLQTYVPGERKGAQHVSTIPRSSIQD